MKRRGRPRTSSLNRAEQLRQAKRAQRERDLAAGWVYVQLKVPAALATKLTESAKRPHFADRLSDWLNASWVRVADYPLLKDIAWNRKDEFLPAKDVFALYERNWRFVDQQHLIPTERTLIQELADRYGNGLINA